MVTNILNQVSDCKFGHFVAISFDGNGDQVNSSEYASRFIVQHQ